MTGAFALAMLAMATSACMSEEGPAMSSEGGDVSVDRSAVFDVSVDSDGSTKADASADDHGGEPQPALDVATDETSVPPPDRASASDAVASDTDAREASTIDTGDLDVAHDSGDPADASVADARATDAPDATPDTDATVPDDATTVPIFAQCNYATYCTSCSPLKPWTCSDSSVKPISVGARIPFAIVDATVTTGGGGRCQCNSTYSLAIHRVMCGSLPVGTTVEISNDCGPPIIGSGDRLMVIVDARGFCPVNVEFNVATPCYLNEWDALLAEQIAGHDDSGVLIDAGLPKDASFD